MVISSHVNHSVEDNRLVTLVNKPIIARILLPTEKYHKIKKKHTMVIT